MDGHAALPPSHAELTELVQECCRSGVPRHALLMSVRRLPPHLTRPHHLRLAREALDPLCQAERARSFDLADGSRVIIWRGGGGAPLQSAFKTLRHLWADEPAIPDIAAIATLFSLPAEAERFRHALSETEPLAIEPAAPIKPPLEKLDPASLQSLEQALVQVNVSRFARHRRIWRVAEDQRLQVAWDKRFLAVAELTETLLPAYDAAADPWLYRRLTRTLDRRLLSLLGAPGELRACGPLSLDLNVGTLLAPEFLRFDAGLPHHLRGNLVIDLLPADIVADPAAYIFARGYLRSRRYRIMIRDVSSLLLRALDFDALDPDLVELEFDDDLIQKAEFLPEKFEMMLSYKNHSGRIDYRARLFAGGHNIRLLSPRD